MVTKAKIPVEEKFDKQDLDLFEVLAALDSKDYKFYERLTEEQQKKFVPYMMTHWMSQVKSNAGIQGYYVRSVDYHANQHLFNEYVQKHPKLQWYMLCASSPGLGKQFHQWVPQLSKAVRELKEVPNKKDVKEYFKKVYTKTSDDVLDEFSMQFVEDQKRKVYLSKKFTNLKIDDIEVLSKLITDVDIEQYEKDNGN